MPRSSRRHTPDTPRIRPEDRLPPQCLEMEQAALGAMLLDPTAHATVAGILHPEDFYRAPHGAIFAALLDIEQSGAPVDLLTLQEALRQTGTLESIGGAPYLIQLTGAVVSPRNAEYYATQVLEASARRSVLAAMDKARDEVYDLEPAALVERLRSLAEDPVLERRLNLDGSHDACAPASQIPTGGVPARLWFGLYEGSVVLLVGETGSGKSSLLYNVALHVAQGMEFCGMRPERGAVRVLYVDPENAGNWKEGRGGVCGVRLERIGLGRPDTLLFHSGDGLNLSMAGHMARLRMLVKKQRVGLVILDPIANLFATEDENSNAEAARQMRFLTELSRTTGACVVACHHMGKDDPGHYGRGASARLAAADVGMVLRSRRTRRDEDEDAPAPGMLRDRRDVCKLEIVKNRLEGTGTLYLEMMGSDRFRVAARKDWDAAGREEVRVEPTRRGQALSAIMGLLADGKRHTRQEILDAAEPYASHRTVDRILRQLVSQRRVNREIHGTHSQQAYFSVPAGVRGLFTVEDDPYLPTEEHAPYLPHEEDSVCAAPEDDPFA